MAPFTYDTPPTSPLVGSIGDLIARGGLQRAQLAEALAQTQSRAQVANAQAWGNATQSLGQLPIQMQEQARRDQLANVDTAYKLTQMQGAQAQLADQQQQRAQRLAAAQAIKSAMETYRDPVTGEVDAGKVASAVDAQFPGYGGQFLTDFSKSREDLNKLAAMNTAARNQETVFIGSQARDATDAHDFVTRIANAHGTNDLSQAAIDRVSKDMASTNAWDPLKAQYMQDAARVAPTKELGKDATLYNTFTNQPVLANPAGPSNEWELLRDAADPTSKTQAQSINALKLYTEAKATPANAELKAGKVDGKGPVVFAVFDPKAKTLTYRGQDVTNRFDAPTDPAEVNAATAARQLAAATRTETQQNLVKAKGDIDKAANSFLQARSAADEIRSIVAEAKSGNNIAGAFQKFQAAASAVRAAGFNRFNTTEMNLPANAGSALDNLEGRVGQFLQGGSASMVPSLQKDMLGYADLLEKGAYHTYQSSHDKANQLWGQSIPYLFDAPSAPAAAAGGGLDPALAARLPKKN